MSNIPWKFASKFNLSVFLVVSVLYPHFSSLLACCLTLSIPTLSQYGRIFVNLYVNGQLCGRTYAALMHKLMHYIFLKIASLASEQKASDIIFFFILHFHFPCKTEVKSHLSHSHDSLTDIVLYRKLRNHFHCFFQERRQSEQYFWNSNCICYPLKKNLTN